MGTTERDHLRPATQAARVEHTEQRDSVHVLPVRAVRPRPCPW